MSLNAQEALRFLAHEASDGNFTSERLKVLLPSLCKLLGVEAMDGNESTDFLWALQTELLKRDKVPAVPCHCQICDNTRELVLPGNMDVTFCEVCQRETLFIRVKKQPTAELVEA